MDVRIGDLVFLCDDTNLYIVRGKYFDAPQGLDGGPVWKLEPILDGLGNTITHGAPISGLESEMEKATLKTAINRQSRLLKAYRVAGLK